MKHWVLVADAASCSIYETDETFASFAKVRSLDNEHVHPEAGALGPRGSTRAGPGGVHSALDRHSDPHAVERSRFAHHVATLVDEGLARGEFERLVIAAPPKFLGDLRSDLSARATSRVVASIHHDFARTPTHDLPAAVRKHLPETAGLDL